VVNFFFPGGGIFVAKSTGEWHALRCVLVPL